jgi:BMFP domain-containing protein YqiC
MTLMEQSIINMEKVVTEYKNKNNLLERRVTELERRIEGNNVLLKTLETRISYLENNNNGFRYKKPTK